MVNNVSHHHAFNITRARGSHAGGKDRTHKLCLQLPQRCVYNSHRGACLQLACTTHRLPPRSTESRHLQARMTTSLCLCPGLPPSAIHTHITQRHTMLLIGFLTVSSTERMRAAASATAVNALILTSDGSHTVASKLSAMSSWKTSTPCHSPPATTSTPYHSPLQPHPHRTTVCLQPHQKHLDLLHAYPDPGRASDGVC